MWNRRWRKRPPNARPWRRMIADKEKLEAELDQKMDRWVYLNELAEKIDTQR